MKTKQINVFKAMAEIVALVTFYILFLIMGQLIPKSLIEDNVEESYKYLNNIGTYFKPVEGASWDNYTDSLFLNTTVTKYDGNILQRAMANAYTFSTDSDTSVIKNLNYALHPDESIQTYAYSRYWAGNVTLYKFLLIFTSIKGIKLILLIISTTLLVLTLFAIRNSLGISGIIPFMVSIFLGMYIPNSLCLVFSTDIIMMLALMVICDKKHRSSDSLVSFCRLFAFAGSLLAYLNYWAFPLITLGMPLVYISALRIKNNVSVKEIIRDNLLISICWAVGLSGTVLIKQLLAYIILGEQTGIEQLEMRMGTGFTLKERFVSVFDGILEQLSTPLVMLVILVSVLYLLHILWSGKMKRNTGIIIFPVIAAYPIVWWFLLAGHSTHGFVEHMFGITYYALLSIICMQDGNIAPNISGYRTYLTSQKLSRAVCGLCICGIFAYFFIAKMQCFYNVSEYRPWSTEIESYAELGNGTEVVQEILPEIYDSIYITNISTILVNLDKNTGGGILNVKLMLYDEILAESQVPLDDIIIGDYFDIPIEAVLYPGYTYKVVYSLENGADINPYLLVQHSSQAVSANKDLYADNQLVEGGLVNKYSYKSEHISTKAKISIILIMTVALQYFLCEMMDRLSLKEVVKLRKIKN